MCMYSRKNAYKKTRKRMPHAQNFGISKHKKYIKKIQFLQGQCHAEDKRVSRTIIIEIEHSAKNYAETISNIGDLTQTEKRTCNSANMIFVNI